MSDPITITSRCNSKIWKQDMYTMSNIDHVLSKRITEYDMSEAGWNLIKYYKLLDDSNMTRLSRMSKERRTIAIGVLMGKNHKFSMLLTKSFGLMRKKFITKNNLIDGDILSIKKDAIFVIAKACKYRKFKNVEFKSKNQYTSYHKFGNIEMYYRYSTNQLDIKGIKTQKLVDHEDYMLKFLKKTFHSLEAKNKKLFIRFMKKFVSAYKERDLDVRFYRELNSDSSFTLTKSHDISKTYIIGLPSMDQQHIDSVNIAYNYMQYVLPILQRHYF